METGVVYVDFRSLGKGNTIARYRLHCTDTGFDDQHPVGIGEAEHRRPHRHLGPFIHAYQGVTGLERGLGVAP